MNFYFFPELGYVQGPGELVNQGTTSKTARSRKGAQETGPAVLCEARTKRNDQQDEACTNKPCESD